jgi:hypothetical protein
MENLDEAYFNSFEALLSAAAKLLAARRAGEHPSHQADLECDVINAASDLTEAATAYIE